jgi:hypothetical protein
LSAVSCSSPAQCFPLQPTSTAGFAAHLPRPVSPALQERHDGRFKEFQDGLHAELMARPVKFSRELLEWRTRESTMAK